MGGVLNDVRAGISWRASPSAEHTPQTQPTRGASSTLGSALRRHLHSAELSQLASLLRHVRAALGAMAGVLRGDQQGSPELDEANPGRRKGRTHHAISGVLRPCHHETPGTVVHEATRAPELSAMDAMQITSLPMCARHPVNNISGVRLAPIFSE